MVAQFPRFPVLGDAVIQKRVSHKNSNFVEGNWPMSQDYSIPLSRQYLIQIPAKKFEFRCDTGFCITASPRLITASLRTGNFGNRATIQWPVRSPLGLRGMDVDTHIPRIQFIHASRLCGFLSPSLVPRTLAHK